MLWKGGHTMKIKHPSEINTKVNWFFRLVEKYNYMRTIQKFNRRLTLTVKSGKRYVYENDFEFYNLYTGRLGVAIDVGIARALTDIKKHYVFEENTLYGKFDVKYPKNEM